MMAGQGGTFVISWAQTSIDGESGTPETSIKPRAAWKWHGEPVQIDAAMGPSQTWPGDSPEAHRKRAASGAKQIVTQALVHEGLRAPSRHISPETDRTFDLTDGYRTWTATLIETPEMARPVLMFCGQMPPRNVTLFIVGGLSDRTLMTPNEEGVVCFTPGTLLETPTGLKPVEILVAGDKVVTKDGGAQPIIWAGVRNVSGARLFATPDLRPVRIKEGALGGGSPAKDLIVSPDHRMLVSGSNARNLWGENEVLIAARDLVDGKGITRDAAAKSVTYFHLMLENHHVLVANGVETESFHPAAAAMDAIEAEQRKRLYDVMPHLANDPTAYGPMSRRALTRTEAAMLPSVA